MGQEETSVFVYLIPLGIALLGVIGLTIYVLTISLLSMVKRVASMNEQLMVFLGTRDGGADVGRALVASVRRPKGDVPGIAKEKKEGPKGLRMTVGAR